MCRRSTILPYSRFGRAAPATWLDVALIPTKKYHPWSLPSCDAPPIPQYHPHQELITPHTHHTLQRSPDLLSSENSSARSSDARFEAGAGGPEPRRGRSAVTHRRPHVAMELMEPDSSPQKNSPRVQRIRGRFKRKDEQPAPPVPR